MHAAPQRAVLFHVSVSPCVHYTCGHGADTIRGWILFDIWILLEEIGYIVCTVHASLHTLQYMQFTCISYNMGRGAIFDLCRPSLRAWSSQIQYSVTTHVFNLILCGQFAYFFVSDLEFLGNAGKLITVGLYQQSKLVLYYITSKTVATTRCRARRLRMGRGKSMYMYVYACELCATKYFQCHYVI